MRGRKRNDKAHTSMSIFTTSTRLAALCCNTKSRVVIGTDSEPLAALRRPPHFPITPLPRLWWTLLGAMEHSAPLVRPTEAGISRTRRRSSGLMHSEASMASLFWAIGSTVKTSYLQTDRSILTVLSMIYR